MKLLKIPPNPNADKLMKMHISKLVKTRKRRERKFNRFWVDNTAQTEVRPLNTSSTQTEAKAKAATTQTEARNIADRLHQRYDAVISHIIKELRQKGISWLRDFQIRDPPVDAVLLIENLAHNALRHPELDKSSEVLGLKKKRNSNTPFDED